VTEHPPEEQEPVLLLCAPVAWSQDVIPDSIEVECDECGQPIFVAPSGQRMMAQGARVVCVPCGQEVMAERGVEPETPTDDQMKELKDTLLRERL
jgi:hypothetical protein